MTSSARNHTRPGCRRLAWLGLLGLSVLSGCGSLIPKPPAPPTLFVLDAPAFLAGAASATATPASTLIVSEPRAAPGYETRQIVYVRTKNELEYFASNQWVEPPAAMLAPLLVRAIESTAAFRAVVRVPTSVAGDLRLDTELVRLQQDFTVVPSRVRLTLRAVLIDTATRRVLASREFDADVVSSSDDPSGGVAAAGKVTHRVLVEVGAFCAEWSAKVK